MPFTPLDTILKQFKNNTLLDPVMNEFHAVQTAGIPSALRMSPLDLRAK
jgi:hypothetical protein